MTTPAFALSSAQNKKSISLYTQDSVTENKISNRLLQDFDVEDKVTFLVKFKEKADVQQIAKEMKQKASLQNQSAYETKLKQRSAVVSELRAIAYETQRDVITLLEQKKETGEVEHFRPYYIVNGIAVTATKEVAEEIANYSEVEKILKDEIRQLHKTTRTNEKPPKSNDEDIEWNVERVKAPEAWEKGIDGSGVVVATIDSGVEWDHPALKEKYRGYNQKTGEVSHDYHWYDPIFHDDIPYDDIGHGTHVTGTIVGSEPDGTNKIGVAPGAKWIAVKAFSHAGGFDSHLLAAAEWLLAPTDYDGNNPRVDLAPDIINNSWGGGPGLDEWYRDVVIAWRSAEIFPEFSAGNTDLFNPGGPGSIAVPANYPESFATGATDENDLITDFSLRGPSPYNEIKPDISAPGENIRSSVPGGGYEGGWEGTSMAGPAVSGVAAMLRQMNASISVDDMEEILINSATPRTDEEYSEVPNNGYGYGIVNAEKAIEFVLDEYSYVEGVVTTFGEDNEPPTYEHTPVEEVIGNMDVDLYIQAKDNVSVTSVELAYQIDNKEVATIQAERISGDHKSGNYLVTIPAEMLVGNIITYQWRIEDFVGHVVESDLYEAEILSGITIGYYEDFEEEPIDWYSFGRNDSWEWGVPTSGPEKAYVGENVYATNLHGHYDPIMDATLVMPQITLPDDQEAYLQFAHWYRFVGPAYPGESADYGHVVISTDQDQHEWETIETYTGSSGEWLIEEIDLSAYAGRSIFIGFKVTSDYVFEQDGWYIDHVSLTDISLENLQQEETKDLQTQHQKDKFQTEQLLPLEAEISSLETGRSTYSNVGTGEYTLFHEIGTFTLKAEAYGYESVQKEVEITPNNISLVDFTLEERSKGTINGKVMNKLTNKPVKDAKVFVLEDANVEPVETDDLGAFTLTAYEGTYTLKIIARDFHTQEVEVEIRDDTLDLDITLEPHYTYPGGEIGYDDGNPDNARAFYDAGNGWAVRMSLPEDKESAIVTEGLFHFWDTSWPTPGGEDFQVEIWDSSGVNGDPGEKILGPIDAKADRSGNWTVIDLREYNIEVQDDFYMVYIQSQPNPNAPGLATDETSPFSGRSYQLVDGEWSQTSVEEGNYMIRARIAHELEDPMITDPTGEYLTNERELAIKGRGSPTTTVQLFHNQEGKETMVVEDNHHFEFQTKLVEGENTIVVSNIDDGVPIRDSNEVKVTLDTIAPEITIESPLPGEEIHGETVTVEGTVYDEHLEYVEVNGQKADLNGNHFSKRVITEEGEMDIAVTAYDAAGNVSEEVITVYVEYEVDQPKPEIYHVTPSEDMTVFPEDEVYVSFESNVEGGQAFFNILLPTGLTSQETNSQSMTEVEPGFYEGTWVVPENFMLDEVVLQVAVENDRGITAIKEAPGKVNIMQKGIDRISGQSRFETAIEISKAGWTEAETVVLARNDDYADALAGVPLAHSLDAPILLTRTDELPTETLSEIKRLHAKNVIILGGTLAISDDVVQSLEEEGIAVERIRGDSRVDTAAEIAKRLHPEGTEKAVIVNGWDFPDALSAASHAAKRKLPILLTHPEKLSEPTKVALETLEVNETVVIGGTLAVSEDVLSELPKPERVRGSNRIETNIAVQEYFNADETYQLVATGNDFADSLTGAVLAAKRGSSILLVRDDVKDITKDYILDQKIKRLTLFGGTLAISEEIEKQLADLLNE